MKIKRAFCILLMIASALLSACGIINSSTPSESDGRAAFENQWKEKLQDGSIKLLSFKKTNGQSAENMGIKFYNLEFEAEVEDPRGFLGGDHATSPRRLIKGAVSFEKTEKGWKDNSGMIH